MPNLHLNLQRYLRLCGFFQCRKYLTFEPIAKFSRYFQRSAYFAHTQKNKDGWHYGLCFLGKGKSDLGKIQEKFMQHLLKNLEPLKTLSIYPSLFSIRLANFLSCLYFKLQVMRSGNLDIWIVNDWAAPYLQIKLKRFKLIYQI